MRVLARILLALLIMQASLVAQDLKIYHIAVGQGDCTLILATDVNANGDRRTVSMLIDAGPVEDKAIMSRVWKYISDTLKAYNVKGLNFLVVSHLHTDHMRGVIGLLNIFKENHANPTTKADYAWIANMQIIDRLGLYDGAKKWVANGDDCWEVDNKSGSVVLKYENLVKDALFKDCHQPINFGQNLFTRFGFVNMSMNCVGLNGWVNGAYEAKTYTRKPKDFQIPKSENDLSFVFLLKFKGFHYFTGGDIGGREPGKKKKYGYSDLETPVAEYIYNRWKRTPPTPGAPEFHLCSFKASHHGSDHSSTTAFLNKMKPRSCVVESAQQDFNGTRIPTESAMTRIKNAGCGNDIFYTFTFKAAGVFTDDPAGYQDVILYVKETPQQNQPIKLYYKMVKRDMNTMQHDPSVVTGPIEVVCTLPHLDP